MNKDLKLCLCCTPAPKSPNIYVPDHYFQPPEPGEEEEAERLRRITTYSVKAVSRAELIAIALDYVQNELEYADLEAYARRVLAEDQLGIFEGFLEDSSDREWLLAQEALYELGFSHIVDNKPESISPFIELCKLHGVNDQVISLLEQCGIAVPLPA